MVFLLILCSYLLLKYRNHLKWQIGSKRQQAVFFFLLLASLITSSLVGIEIFSSLGISIPGIPLEIEAPIIFLLSALPWMFASGIFGLAPALLISLISSSIYALWVSHQLITPLESCLLVILFFLLINNKHPGQIKTNSPLLTGIKAVVLLIPVLFINPFFISNGQILLEIGDWIKSGLFRLIQYLVPVISAGYLCAIAIKNDVVSWKYEEINLSTMTSRSLSNRFFNRLLPVALVMFAIIVAVVWRISTQLSEQFYENRLKDLVYYAQNEIPMFFETGQSELDNLTKSGTNEQSLNQLVAAFDQHESSNQFFQYIAIYDASGQLVRSSTDFNEKLSDVELNALKNAYDGAEFQIYELPPNTNTDGTRFIFLQRINEQDNMIGVVIGYTSLSQNRITTPLIRLLNETNLEGGNWFILDHENKVLHSSDVSSIYSSYQGDLYSVSEYQLDRSMAGAGNYSFSSRIVGPNWLILVTIPSDETRMIAMEIALPITSMLVIFLIIFLVFWRFTLNSISNSIRILGDEAEAISSGNLTSQLDIERKDELGQLASSLDTMRKKLRQRIDEMGKVLVVSNSVAENLNFEEAVRPILDNIIESDVHFGRICLISNVIEGELSDEAVTFSSSRIANDYAYLDNQLMEMMRDRDYLEIPNCYRERRLQFHAEKMPGALIAVSIFYKNEFFGILWLGYDAPHQFTTEEIRYFTTMAGQASLAASNASLYYAAHTGKQRLEGVLNAIPDPVFVIDSLNQIITANHAATIIDGNNRIVEPGTPVSQVITNEKLLELFLSNTDSEFEEEITLKDGRIFSVRCTSVPNTYQNPARIWVFKDVTYYKTIDKMRLEFVSTVSHELKTPLSLLKGYGTMIQMVGQLNERQKNYLDQMTLDLESLSRLVNNLLDLDRLESGESLKMTNFSCNDLLDEAAQLFQPVLTQNKLNLTVTKLDRDLLLSADRELIFRAVYNLIENAIKYTMMNGSIEIGCQQQSSSMTFFVKDTGKGISPIDLRNIFTKLHTSDSTGGMGHSSLGLSIVNSIVRRHGGKVHADSQLGKGSIFSFEIPMKPRA